MRAATLFVALLFAIPARADLTVGVFLPTTLADGQLRFDFGEKLAAQLGKAMNQKASARNFARYVDFQQALKQGKLDVAVVDGWIAAEGGELPVVALGSINGSTRRKWSVIARAGKTMSAVLGKTLALTRGAGNIDLAFVTNAVFGGALIADQSMKPTYAPSVESTLKLWSLGNADAALVPAPMAPPDAKVLYQSSPLPIAVVLAQRQKADAVKRVIPTLGMIAPFDGFTTVGVEEMGALKRLVQAGPATRPPVWAEEPPLPLDPHSLVTFHGLSPVFPSFLELVNPSKEQPDD